jgi:hypothetical protein
MPRFRLRYTISGLMVLVAGLAVALAGFLWASRATTYPVAGTVISKGQPVRSGQIVFSPRAPGGYQAVGPIVAGRFTLTTFTRDDGAVAGPYAVAIIGPGVPAKYQSPSTSGLSVQVRMGGVNMFSFEVVD